MNSRLSSMIIALIWQFINYMSLYMNLKTVLIWIFISISTISLCQETSPEIFNPETVYRQQEVDTILVYCRKNARKIQDYSGVKKILSSNKELSGWPYYYFFKAKERNLAKDYDSSIIYADKGIQFYENSKIKRDFDEKALLETYVYKAISLEALKRYDESIISNQKALDFTKKYPYKWKSFVKASIARGHLEMGNNSIALEYYLSNTKDTLYMNLDRPAVITYTSIGLIYFKFEDFKSAKKYYKKGVERSIDGTYKENLWFLYLDIGDIYRKEQNNDSTLLYYKKAINHYEESDTSHIPDFNLLKYLKGYIELHEGDISQSVNYFNEIITYYNEIPNSKGEKKFLMDVYNGLGEAYQKTNNARGLKTILESSNKFLEEFHNDQLAVNLNDLELKYQTKEKDISIAELEETTESQKIIIQQRNTINWVLGGLLLSFMGLGYLFNRQRRLQSQYKASNLEQRLLRSQLNPHFLFNALNSVSGLVQKKSDQTIPYISKLGELLRSILENSREEFISLEEELETIVTYLELQSNFSKKFTFEIQVDKSLNKDELLISPMFLQPFIENTIDHGFKGKDNEKITISVHQKSKDQVLYFSIEDNGIGYSNTMKNKKDVLGHQSLSGTILKERLALYARAFKKKARYVIGDVDAGRGTRVELWLPYLIED